MHELMQAHGSHIPWFPSNTKVIRNHMWPTSPTKVWKPKWYKTTYQPTVVSHRLYRTWINYCLTTHTMANIVNTRYRLGSPHGWKVSLWSIPRNAICNLSISCAPSSRALTWKYKAIFAWHSTYINEIEREGSEQASRNILPQLIQWHGA